MLQEQVLSVCLTDTNSSEDIHINDLLVHEGYAIFCPDTEEILHAIEFNQGSEVSMSSVVSLFNPLQGCTIMSFSGQILFYLFIFYFYVHT